MGEVRAPKEATLGAYVLERKLGAGGMAEVYLARRTGPHGFQKRVAIKRILPGLSRDAGLIQMFCDEARVAATLTHPNIVQVLEFGEDRGELYLVMEYVDGISCSALLRAVSERGETIPVSPALCIVREALLALAFAHEAADENGHPLGVVHRDVSPSNILVSRIGTVKLIDFGITRSFIAERRTYPGELKGKLRYMSPEQILGADVDLRSDLFAAGIVLAEMLAGRALFSGRSDLDILARISRGELGIVRDGKLPTDLSEMLEKALAHRPADRFQTARDFVRAIDDVATLRGIRLDDSALVPYLHSLGLLPSTSGTRPIVNGEALRPTVPVRQPNPALAGSPDAGPSSLTAPEAPRSRFESGERRAPSSSGTERTTGTPHRGSASSPDARQRASSFDLPRGSPPARSSGTYRLKTRSGKLVGPFRRADMLALLATGRLSSRSHVSLSADSFVPLNTLPALSALANHPAYRFREDDVTSPEWLERIDAVAVPTALYRIALEKRTGLLAAVDGKRRKRVYFQRGDPVFVASTDRDELLGQRLRNAGVVSEKILEFALASQPPFRVGEALVSFGALGAAQLVRELAKQLEDRVIDLGRYRSGELRFFPDVVLDETLHIRAREPTLELVARLVRDQFPPGDIAGLLRPITNELLVVGTSYDGLSSSLGLSPAEAAVLNLADEARTVRETVNRAASAGVAMADALRAIFIGLCSGSLQAAGWPPRSLTQSQTG